MNEQVEARSEQLAQSIALLQKDAQILSSFAGEVLRIERKPENKIVVHSVFYRESPTHQQLQGFVAGHSRFMVGRMDGSILRISIYGQSLQAGPNLILLPRVLKARYLGLARGDGDITMPLSKFSALSILRVSQS